MTGANRPDLGEVRDNDEREPRLAPEPCSVERTERMQMTSDSQSESGDVVSSTAWFGIDTAPTDGTLFIGLKGKHVAPTKRGKYYVKWPHQEGGPTFEERWDEVQPDHICPWNPTHWTPMPNK